MGKYIATLIILHKNLAPNKKDELFNCHIKIHKLWNSFILIYNTYV